jgi:hypothetical protein
MSKTNETSKFDQAKLETCVLGDSELDAVSGGTVVGQVQANMREKSMVRQAQALLNQW